MQISMVVRSYDENKIRRNFNRRNLVYDENFLIYGTWFRHTYVIPVPST